jgi:hypothetical protein
LTTLVRRVALTAATLAAVGVSCLAAAQPQRLAGRLLIGPNCPGPEREGQACPSVPYTGVTVQLLGDGKRLAGQAVSDSQGRFAISAPPGRYQALVLAPKLTRCPSPEIELPQQSADPLVIDCDSGRR